MILPIYIYGHPILRTLCKNINPDYQNLDVLIDDMFATMKNAHGVGLSAPQIGRSINLFIIDLSVYAEENPLLADTKEVFINPVIVKEFGEVDIHNEGCLSIPGLRADVERKNTIEVTYYDQQWKRHSVQMDGILARVFQHEYDHLNKVLFIDYLKPLKKNIVNRKLKYIQKGKFDNDYPTILKQ